MSMQKIISIFVVACVALIFVSCSFGAYGPALQKQDREMKGVSVGIINPGLEVPDFKVMNAKGEMVKFSQFREGKVTVLTFW